MFRRFMVTAVAGGTLALAAVSPAGAGVGTDSSALREAVTTDGILDHLEAFQAIADANGDTRASGTPGYDASVAYVAERLDDAGYEVSIQDFGFDLFREEDEAAFARVSPDPASYTLDDDFATMEFSGSGDVTGALVPTNDIVLPPASAANTSTSGCEPEDFVPASATEPQVALVQRGSCAFAAKALNAEAAGYDAVVIFNEGQAGRTDTVFGTLGDARPTIPVLGASFAVGDELYSMTQAGGVVVRVYTSTSITPTETSNVIADTPGGRDDRTVVVGAHLDSVLEGPGIQDNGSGSATILEIAEAMSELEIEPTNRVRFAFWGAEESGLVGSDHYVSTLSKRDLKDIALNLNFDMVASPNYVRFVYDGDGSDTPVAGPNGSGRIEQVFLDYFASQGLATEPTAQDGRSDYAAFTAFGVPAGGLFTGAEGIKTEAEAAEYGGTAGVAYDPCYHQACDTIANVNTQALDEMSDAAAHATLEFAMTSSAVNGTAKSSQTSAVVGGTAA
jgi:Zn-dependent M28 family amino/carboxypeptidase